MTPANLTAVPANDWVALATSLAARFAERAARHDEEDSFVAENIQDLRDAGFYGAHVPAELGGGGASYAEICAAIRVLARGCGSTALALSMHTHVTAVLVSRWRRQKAPVDGLLRRVAAEKLVLVSSGGSDWLDGSGQAVAVEGGYRIFARKIFASGCPAGALLMTTAVLDDPAAGSTVLHFPVSLTAQGVSIAPNWRVLGMRGTGSHEIILDDVFVPEASVSVRRPRGQWHPSMHLISLIAFPIIYSAYAGLADEARAIALRAAAGRAQAATTQLAAGEIENDYAVLELAMERLVKLGAEADPGAATTNAIFTARALAGQAAVRTVEKALELAGGRAFHRSMGLERIFRDVQAARFHPLREKDQLVHAGRIALGLSI